MTEKDYVLVTGYFHPDSASTAQLMTDLATGVADRGLPLSVYTTQPNYHVGDHERQPRSETHDGVPVRRIRAPQLGGSSLPHRLFNWAVFTLWMFVVLATHREAERELVFVSNPPFLPPAMWLLCKLRGWDYTFIVYDLYPDVIVASGFLDSDGFVYRVWSYINAHVLANANNVVALGQVMRERIIEAAGPGLDPDSVSVIHNWADGEFIQPMDKADNPFSQEHDLVDPFTLLYSGNIGTNHDLETVVEAARAFADEPVRFLIIGEGDMKDHIVGLADQYGLTGDTVEFMPFLDYELLPHSLTSADVSLVSVQEGMKGLCVSSKLYTSLAAGQPVLVVSEPEDDEARIVRRHDAGLTVSQGDVHGMVEAIERWRSDPGLVERQGTNARAAFEAHFTKERSLDRYYRVLSEGAESVSDSTGTDTVSDLGSGPSPDADRRATADGGDAEWTR